MKRRATVVVAVASLVLPACQREVDVQAGGRKPSEANKETPEAEAARLARVKQREQEELI